MQHLVDDRSLSALWSASGSAYMSPWRRLDWMPGRFELDPRQPKHLRRAVDADRLGWRAGRTARSSGRCRCRCRPAGRAAACQALGRSPARPRFRRHAASGSGPRPRRGRRNSGWRPRRARRGSIRSARRRRRTARCVAASAQPSTSANSGSTRSASASVRNTQLPSLRRSSTPASARILRWRETRGWLCPSTCASSPDRQLHQPQQRDDAQPRRIGKRLESIGKRKAACHEIRI